jgi:hypothetical protein
VDNVEYLVFQLVRGVLKVCLFPFYIVDKGMRDYHKRQIENLELEVLKEREKLNKLEIELLKAKEKQNK